MADDDLNFFDAQSAGTPIPRPGPALSGSVVGAVALQRPARALLFPVRRTNGSVTDPPPDPRRQCPRWSE